MVCGYRVSRNECVCVDCEEREALELRYAVTDMEGILDDFQAEDLMEKDLMEEEEEEDDWDDAPAYEHPTEEMQEMRILINTMYGTPEQQSQMLRLEEARVRIALACF
jgi:hypothetical protein